MKATRVEVGGNRVVLVGTYEMDNGDGEAPETRVFMASGWASTPALPFRPETVDVPLTALPELIAALQGIGGSE